MWHGILLAVKYVSNIMSDNLKTVVKVCQEDRVLCACAYIRQLDLMKCKISQEISLE